MVHTSVKILTGLPPRCAVHPAALHSLLAGVPGFLRGPFMRFPEFMRRDASPGGNCFEALGGQGLKADRAFLGVWCHSSLLALE